MLRTTAKQIGWRLASGVTDSESVRFRRTEDGPANLKPMRYLNQEPETRIPHRSFLRARPITMCINDPRLPPFPGYILERVSRAPYTDHDRYNLQYASLQITPNAMSYQRSGIPSRS